MKKKPLILLCLLLLCLSMAIPAFADEALPRVVDYADCLTEAEESELLAKLDDISARQGMDVVIVTVQSLYGQDVTAFADNFYDENGYSPDGILLMVSTYDREWAISTAGYGITAFTDAGLDYMAGQFVGAMSEEKFHAAFHTYADLCDEFISQAKAGKPYDVDSLPKAPFNVVKMLLISLGIGLFAALIITGSMKSKLKSVYAQPAAAEYVKRGSMHISQSREMFLYRRLDRRKKEPQKTGGSSTHTSSSGRSHGGSSGSF